MKHSGIRGSLENYIYRNIVPQYAAFDPAHREDHAVAVIDNSLKLYDEAPEEVRSGIDPEILFTAAACHDLGRINGKENHHTDSGKIIRADENLRQWFDASRIELIAQAAEDHRASGKSEPRSIYGKIVAEADRVIDAGTIIRRTVQYGLTRYPELGAEEQIARAETHLAEKYGPGGYLRLWIPWSGNASRLEDLRALISDAASLHAAVSRVFFTLCIHSQ